MSLVSGATVLAWLGVGSVGGCEGEGWEGSKSINYVAMKRELCSPTIEDLTNEV